MGILSTVFGRDLARVNAALPPSVVVDPSTYPIASPWSDSDLQRIVFSDIFGSDIPENTRSAAMRIATVARARGMLTTAAARMPMFQLRAGEELPTDPEARLEVARRAPWLFTTGDATTPYHRMLYTIDDHIFYGWSCWWRGLNAQSSRFPLQANRLNQGDWSVNKDWKVEVHGQVASDEQVILMAGPHEGILSYGVDVIRDARNLYSAVSDRIEFGNLLVNLHQVKGEPLNKAERQELLSEWRAARRTRGGSVGYSNDSIEVNVEAMADDGKLMIEARNAAAVDLARMIGIHAGMVDATAPKASLNYETTSGRNSEFLDLDVEAYLGPIEARFSMDDLSPAGSKVVFDRSALASPTLPLTGPNVAD